MTVKVVCDSCKQEFETLINTWTQCPKCGCSIMPELVLVVHHGCRDDNTRHINGLIDDFAILDRALSPQEVKAIYDSRRWIARSDENKSSDCGCVAGRVWRL